MTAMILGRDDFERILIQGTRFIDVRAPVEYALGSVPGSINLPILNDDERHAIGICYRNDGPDAAVQLGHQLVSGLIRDERIRSWVAEVDRHPGAVIYCFRGGMRSRITQSWLAEQGLRRPIIEGGYKALRRFLIEVTEEKTKTLQFKVVSGPTGSGKTKYLKFQGKRYVDLEALAEHRGSAFGGLPSPQPTQVDFENRLALELLKIPPDEDVLIEDESRMIGKRFIPDCLFEKMEESPRIILEIPIETRVENIFQDYIMDSSLGVSGDLFRFEDFRGAVRAISRRLGDELTKIILTDLDHAQSEFSAGRGLVANRIWIRKLLERYYDPLYLRGVTRRLISLNVTVQG